METAKEKRTKLVGVRLRRDIFECLEAEANLAGMSPTSRARGILSEYFGHDDSAHPRRSPRKPKALLFKDDLKAVTSALVGLVSIQAGMRKLSVQLRQHCLDQYLGGPATLEAEIAAIQSELSAIKKAVVEAAK